MNNNDKCGTCRFYFLGVDYKEPRGFCRRHAPLPVQLDTSADQEWENWKIYTRSVSAPPIVAYGDWCGEHELRKP